MSTKTKYIIQGLFFLILALFCVYLYVSGKSDNIKHFSIFGSVFAGFIGILFLKNGLKK